MPNINIDDAYILNETGAQVDKVTGLYFKDESTSAAEKAFAQLNIGTAGSNRNLLDNPWFTVNQRGLTSGTHTTMPADRWKATYGSGSVNWTRESDGCITFAPTNAASHGDIYQRIPDEIYDALAGTDKTVTVSVMMQDGTIYSGTSYLPTTNTRAYIDVRNVGGTSSRLVVYVQASTKQLFVQAYYGSLTVKAVKLEKGSVSTLANDAPPDYGEELRKCMRYFVRFRGEPIGVGYISSNLTNVYLHITTGVQMAKVPTASLNGGIQVRGANGTVGASSISVYNQLPTEGANVILLLSSQSSTTSVCTAYLNSVTDYIDLSADL